jgi:hypothetical protein
VENTAQVSLSAELTEKAAKVVSRIKARTNIPKKFLIEEAIINYLPEKYEKQKT